MVSYGGEQSLDRYLAISARGMPFNVAHAAGNFVLALAAGPALVRMIARYRERFEFRWRPGRGDLAPLVALLAAALAVARRRLGGRRRRERPASSAGSSALRTPTAASATGPGGVVERGDDGLGGARPRGRGRATRSTCRSGGATADRLPARAEAGGLSSAGDLERTILALDGAGVSPRRFGGRTWSRSFAADIASGGSVEGRSTSPRSGSSRCAPRAPRVLGSRSARLRGCARAQNRDGGWGFQPSAASDADSTGAALQGLAAAGATGQHERRGVALPAPRPGPRRRLRAGRHQRLQLPVHRLGGPGAGRGGRRARGGAGARPPRSTTSPGASAGDGHYRYSASSDQTPVWVTAQALAGRQARGLPAAPGGPAGAPQAVVGARGRRIQRVRCFLGRSHDQPDSDRHVNHGRRRLSGDRVGAPGEWGAVGEGARSPPADRSGRGGAAHRPAPWSLVRMGSRSAPRWTPRRRPRLATATPTRPPTSRVGSRPWRLPWRPASSGTAGGSPDGSSGSLDTVSAMDVEKRFAPAGRTRRTSPSPCDRAVLDELFELARWAPNHNLTNPWRFRVVGPRALERLKEAAGPEAAASSTAPRPWSSARASSAATRSRTRRTSTRRRAPRTSSCSPPTRAASPATGAPRGAADARRARRGGPRGRRAVRGPDPPGPAGPGQAPPERAPVGDVVTYLD